MKLCIISDLHGSTLWKSILEHEKDEVERFIFLGDYFDSKKEGSQACDELDNLEAIVEQRKKDARLILLAGNHDLQYMGGSRTSGYRKFTDILARDFLTELAENDVLQVAVCFDKYLISHAGISKSWLETQQLDSWQDANRLLKEHPERLSFVSGEQNDPTGDDIYQSPMWIRPRSLLRDAVDGFSQIVGHTRMLKIHRHQQGGLDYFFTDTTMRQYLLIDTLSGTYQIKDCPDITKEPHHP